MEINTQNHFLIRIVFLVLFLIGIRFLINHYFEKGTQFKAFEECLSVVSDPTANWITRKGTIEYCKEETH